MKLRKQHHESDSHQCCSRSHQYSHWFYLMLRAKKNWPHLGTGSSTGGHPAPPLVPLRPRPDCPVGCLVSIMNLQIWGVTETKTQGTKMLNDNKSVVSGASGLGGGGAMVNCKSGAAVALCCTHTHTHSYWCCGCAALTSFSLIDSFTWTRCDLLDVDEWLHRHL